VCNERKCGLGVTHRRESGMPIAPTTRLVYTLPACVEAIAMRKATRAPTSVKTRTVCFPHPRSLIIHVLGSALER
jgi:hypothetical protein